MYYTLHVCIRIISMIFYHYFYCLFIIMTIIFDNYVKKPSDILQIVSYLKIMLMSLCY